MSNRMGHQRCPLAQRCQEHGPHRFWATFPGAQPLPADCEGFSLTEDKWEPCDAAITECADHESHDLRGEGRNRQWWGRT